MRPRPQTKHMIGSRPSKELKNIISCKNAADLAEHVTKKQYEELMGLSTHINHAKHIVSIAQSLNSSLKLFMLPVDVFLVALGSLSLFVSGTVLLPLTLGVLLIGFGLFGYGTYKAHKESKEKREHTRKFFELADLKFQAYNELIKRKRAKILNLAPSTSLTHENSIWRKAYSVKPTYAKRTMVLESLGAAITPTLSLGIASIAIASIFQTIGMLTLATFIFTPLGLAIAAGLAITGIAISIFVGIKHYQSSANKHLVVAEENKMKFLIREQKEEYKSLEKKYLKIKMRHQNKEDNQATLKSSIVVKGKIITFPPAHEEYAGLRFLDLSMNSKKTQENTENPAASQLAKTERKERRGKRFST